MIDYEKFFAQKVALWINLALYGPLLLLGLALVPGRLLCVVPAYARTRSRQHGHVLLIIFAASRCGWASYLLIDGARFSSHSGPGSDMARVACLVDALCDSLFFVLTALILVQVADVLTTGWKSSQRLWRLFYLTAGVMLPYLASLVVCSHGWGDTQLLEPSSPTRSRHVSWSISLAIDIFDSTMSLLAALALGAIALRYR